MKVFGFLLLVVAVCAEAGSLKMARIEAPYPTPGYPQGPSLNLPGEYGTPQDGYGTPGSASEKPEDAYGSPTNKPEEVPEDAYGMPEEGTTEAVNTEAETVTEVPDADGATETIPEGQSQKLRAAEDVKVEPEIYYVYTPNGLVQNVPYDGSDIIQDINSAYTAQINYQRIQNPYFTYFPENYYYTEVQK